MGLWLSWIIAVLIVSPWADADPFFEIYNGRLLVLFTFEKEHFLDQSGYAHHGTVSGAELVQSGIFGSGLRFNGRSQLKVPLNINPHVLAKVSFGSWVRPSSSANDPQRKILVSHGGEDGSSVRSLFMQHGSWCAGLGNMSFLCSSTPVVVGRWAFVVAVYDDIAATLALHVDNSLTTSSVATPIAGLDYMLIGAGFADASSGFRGTLDNVFVYGDTLNQADIAFLAGAAPTLPPPCAGSSGYALSLGNPRNNKGYLKVDGTSIARNLYQLTIGLWVKPSSIKNSQVMTLMSKATNGFRLSLYHEPQKNSSDLRFELGDSTSGGWTHTWNTHLSVIDGLRIWTHILVTWDGFRIRVYLNGVLAAHRQNSACRLALASSTPLLIGATMVLGNSEKQDFFEGELDEVQLWSRALRFNEVIRVLRHRNIGIETDLILYLQFDSGRGVTLTSNTLPAVTATYDSMNAGFRPEYVVSNCGSDDLIIVNENTATFLVLNGTDASRRPLFAHVTRFPTFGDLYFVDHVGLLGVRIDASSGASIPIGKQLAYLPHLNVVGEDFLTYVVRSDDLELTYFNSAVVLITILDVEDPPRLIAPTRLTLALEGYRVNDVDSWETDGPLSVTLDMITGDESSYLMLGFTKGLDFKTPVNFISDRTLQFTGRLDDANKALDSISVSLNQSLSNTDRFHLRVDDMGNSGLGGYKYAEHVLGVSIRTGGVPVIGDVFPLESPVSGGSTVAITGLSLASVVTCVFGNTSFTSASVLSPVQINCPIPPHTAAFVHLQVISDSGFLSNTVQFRFREMSHLLLARPLWGPVEGGTQLLVTGGHFSSLDQVQCRFDNSSIMVATFVSAGAITCMTPPTRSSGMPRSVNVSISYDGKHFVSTGDKFHYAAHVNVNLLSPNSGPELGGTSIVVRGRHFRNSSTLACSFGGLILPGSFVSESKIHCVTPAITDLGYRVSGGHIQVTVTVNGLDYSSESLYFVFTPLPVMLRLSPASGPLSGGTVVSVHGRHFSSGEKHDCHFGKFIIPALFISDTLALCSAPSIVSPGTVTVRFSRASAVLRFSYHVVVAPSKSLAAAAHSTMRADIVTTMASKISSADLICGFSLQSGFAVTTATMIAPSAIQCAAPVTMVPSGKLLLNTTISVAFSDASDANNARTFSFYADSKIFSSIPSSGPAGGGTSVSLCVRNGAASASPLQPLQCRFGNSRVNAHLITMGIITCVSPPSRGGFVYIGISLGEVHFPTHNVSLFTNAEQHRVASVYPNTAATSRKERLVVRGYGFLNVSTLTCKFGGGIFARAVWVNSTEVACTTPTLLQVGVYSIDISNNGWDFSLNGAFLRVVPLPVISSISPMRGPSYGGTFVTIQGRNFTRLPGLVCVFGESVALSTRFISGAAVVCESPPFPSNNSMLVTLKLNVLSRQIVPGANHLFTFESPMTIFGCTPAAGPTSGGTVIVVTGSTFSAAGVFRCLLCGVQVVGRRVSASMLECVTPVVRKPGSCSLLISVNGVDFVESTVYFTYVAPARVFHLYPSVGTLGLATEVTVHGSNFINVDTLLCKLGSFLTTRASFTSSTRVQCLLPALNASLALTLEVSIDGQHYSSSQVYFFNHNRSSSPILRPFHGPSRGGTLISIIGCKFYEHNDLHCSFDDHNMKATLSGHGVISCTSPPRLEHNRIELIVRTSLDECAPLIYTFNEDAAIATVKPQIGRTSGGALVSINGAHFVNSSSLGCRFGDVMSPSVAFINSTHVSCVSPAHTVGSVAVEVTNNNADFTDSGVEFEFVGTVAVAAIHPRNGPVNGGTASATLFPLSSFSIYICIAALLQSFRALYQCTARA